MWSESVGCECGIRAESYKGELMGNGGRVIRCGRVLFIRYYGRAIQMWPLTLEIHKIQLNDLEQTINHSINISSQQGTINHIHMILGIPKIVVI